MIEPWVRTTQATVRMGAAVLAALRRPSPREEWETLSPDDAPQGDFVTLSDGARMHFIACGPGAGPPSGQTLILIHGLTSSTHEWARNIQALAQTHRVIAVDLIGFGYSTRVTEPRYSLRYQARAVRELMDTQGIARASLVGHSLGGAVALQIAHDAPERVGKLILIDAAAYIFGWLKPIRWAVRTRRLPRAVACRSLSDPRVLECGLRNALGDSRRLDPQALAERVRLTRVRGTADAWLAMLASPEASTPPEGLGRIRAPALVLWGERDAILHLPHGRRLARELGAPCVVIEGAGHLPNAECPDRVNQLILEFVGG